MNLTDTKQAIGIAKQQAAISEGKMKYWKAQNATWKATMYSIRMKALRCYVKDLEKQLRNHDKRQFKKQEV